MRKPLDADAQYDLVLISQILDVHNCELLTLLNEPAFRRYITADELTRLTNTLNLPELFQDLRFFRMATRSNHFWLNKVS